jgi:hypothetical protein
MRLPCALPLIMAFSVPCFSADFQVSDFEIYSQSDGASIAIAINGSGDHPPKYKVYSESDPNHLVIELQLGGDGSAPLADISRYSSNLIKAIRVATRQDGFLRYDLDLNYPLDSYGSDLIQGENSAYLLKVHLVTSGSMKEEDGKPAKKSILTPTGDPGLYELRGTAASKMLDFRDARRIKIGAKEFIDLFGGENRSSRISVIGAEMLSSRESSELVIDLSDTVEYALKVLHKPERTVLDIKNACGHFCINAQHLGDALVKRVRSV